MNEEQDSGVNFTLSPSNRRMLLVVGSVALAVSAAFVFMWAEVSRSAREARLNQLYTDLTEVCYDVLDHTLADCMLVCEKAAEPTMCGAKLVARYRDRVNR